MGVRDGEKKEKIGKREQWRTEETSLGTLKIPKVVQEDRKGASLRVVGKPSLGVLCSLGNAHIQDRANHPLMTQPFVWKGRIHMSLMASFHVHAGFASMTKNLKPCFTDQQIGYGHWCM